MNSSPAVCLRWVLLLCPVFIGLTACSSPERLPGKSVKSDNELPWSIEIRPEDSFESARRHKISLDGKIRDVYIDFKDGSSGIKHLDESGVVKSLEVDVKEERYPGIVKTNVNEDGNITSISVFDKKSNKPIYEIKEENNQAVIKFYENGNCRAVGELSELGNYAHWTFYQKDGVTLQSEFDLRDNFTPSARPYCCNADEQGALNYNNIRVYNGQGNLVYQQKSAYDKPFKGGGEWLYKCQVYNSMGILTHRANIYADNISTLRANVEKLNTAFKFPVLSAEEWITQPGWLLDFSLLKPQLQIEDPETIIALDNFWDALQLRNDICQGRNCYLFYLQSMLSP